MEHIKAKPKSSDIPVLEWVGPIVFDDDEMDDEMSWRYLLRTMSISDFAEMVGFPFSVDRVLVLMVQQAHDACLLESMNCPWCSGLIDRDDEHHDDGCSWIQLKEKIMKGSGYVSDNGRELFPPKKQQAPLDLFQMGAQLFILSSPTLEEIQKEIDDIRRRYDLDNPKSAFSIVMQAMYNGAEDVWVCHVTVF